jgi:hypothetical protein
MVMGLIGMAASIYVYFMSADLGREVTDRHRYLLKVLSPFPMLHFHSFGSGGSGEFKKTNTVLIYYPSLWNKYGKE